MSNEEKNVHPNLVSALAAFQRTLPTVKKGNVAKVAGKEGKQGYSYDYADLTDVSDAVIPALAEQGLAWMCLATTAENGDIVIEWELAHGESGESRRGVLPIGRPGAAWQSLGSAMTYARRYALIAVTGVAPGGDDDDAASASRAGEAQQQPVAHTKEYLPAGLYDLGSLTDVEAVRVMFRKARGAGHLALLVAVEEDGKTAEVPFGKYLTDLGVSLTPAPGEEPKDDVDPEEAAVQAQIAAHEAELAEQEDLTEKEADV